MKNKATTNAFVVLIVLFSGLQTMLAQPFWTETFVDQSTATTNWVHGGANAGAEVWSWTNDPLAGFMDPSVPGFSAPTVDEGYFYFNSDANGEGNGFDVTLTGAGNPANCSGKTDVHLKFYAQFLKFNGDSKAYVGVSTDGINFTDYEVFASVGSEELYEGETVLDIDPADNAAQVWIRFRWTGNWEYHWKIDDVSLEGLSGPLTCDQNPMAIICDNFESYSVGPVSPQATWWLPWDGNEASSVSGEVSTDFASQGAQSMKIIQDDDQLLLLGNKNAGRYSLKWKQYVPAGKAAHINVQTDQDNPGASTANYSAQIYFRTDGTTNFNIPLPATESTYPQGEWFQLEFVFDLDNNLLKVFLNGGLLRTYVYTQQLGAVDFYGADETYTFYVDEVEFVELPALVYDPDECATAVDLTLYFGQTPGVAQTTGLFDNTDASGDVFGPYPACFEENDGGSGTDTTDASLWFTFTGDGANYHIETVPCNATNYIGTGQNRPGDSQMAIYTGECGVGTLVVEYCNDNLYSNGMPDWRSGVDIQTTSGTNYTMLIDGFRDFPGTFINIAKGEFCIEITREAMFNCSNAQMGTYTVDNSGVVCWGTNLNALITLDEDSYVIPQNGPVNGMAWALTSAPVPADTWPPSLGASYFGSTGYLQTPFAVGLNNNGSFPVGTYYITPVIVGGAVDINPANTILNLAETDPTNGCFFVGESYAITLLPVLDEIQAVGDVTNETVPPGNNGAIDLTIEGGYPGFLQDPGLYIITWSNGATSNPVTDLAGGDYGVTISDPTGCVDDFVTTITVGTISGTGDPASVKQLTVSPNPAVDQVHLNLVLETASEVRLEIANVQGQLLQTIHAGKVTGLSQTINLANYASGTYFLRVVIGGETAVRGIQVQR